MTDYAELAKRLRASVGYNLHPEAADAIEAQAARIAGLQALGDELAQGCAGRFARPDGMTVVDFMRLWLEQARDAQRAAEAEAAKLRAEVAILTDREFIDYMGEPVVTSDAALQEILHLRAREQAMTDTQWIAEKAQEVVVSTAFGRQHVAAMREVVAAALRKAEERWMKRGRALQAHAEGTSHRQTFRDARLAERQAIEARLRTPDEAMVEAVLIAHQLVGPHRRDGGVDAMKVAMIAIADALFPSSETPEAPSKEGE